MDLQLSLHPEPFSHWALLAHWEERLAAPPASVSERSPAHACGDNEGSGSGACGASPSQAGGDADAAATALFIGRVRGITAAGLPLEALELEHYPGMTESQLECLANAYGERHGAKALRIAHRVGRVLAGEAIVLVAVAADRRGPAQRCCQELLEALKHEAPFWKREWSGGAGSWVLGNTPLGWAEPGAAESGRPTAPLARG
jgi:molybdopterin synthase catalytic subunit